MCVCVCVCVCSHESHFRSINVKAEYPVKVKTVVGHSFVGVCGCVCSVAALLIMTYGPRYSK